MSKEIQSIRFVNYQRSQKIQAVRQLRIATKWTLRESMKLLEDIVNSDHGIEISEGEKFDAFGGARACEVVRILNESGLWTTYLVPAKIEEVPKQHAIPMYVMVAVLPEDMDTLAAYNDDAAEIHFTDYVQQEFDLDDPERLRYLAALCVDRMERLMPGISFRPGTPY